jgi:hypothetical protein
MKIVRQTDSEIVVEDSSSLFSLHKSTYAVNAATKSIQWNRLGMTGKQAGSLAFSEVQDIVIDTRKGGNPRQPCRLSIRTAAGTLPMSAGYKMSRESAATLRDTLLTFIRADAAQKSASAAATFNTDAVRTQQLNDAIRALLTQGKKIDAILLVQQSEHLDLTEATFRVNQVANQMGMKQPSR